MSAETFVVGCVQVNPKDDREANIREASNGVREAAARGASLVVLPEYVTFLHASGRAMRENAIAEGDEPALPAFCSLAKELQVWILVGSIAVLAENDKLANRSFLISAAGEIVARYDKLHMFDATLPGGREIRESSSYQPGNEAVIAETPWTQLGLSICYDVRFPTLYRELSQAGAEVLAIPAAFTKATGTLHWKSLLQARAIENGAYILAAATCGEHPGGHKTYGHAMIVDPNGAIVAEAGDDPRVICAEIDLSLVRKARAQIPSLRHDRQFAIHRTGAAEEQYDQV